MTWGKIRLGDLVDIKTGKLDANESSETGLYPFFTCSVEPLKINKYSFDCEAVLVAGNGDLNVKYYEGKFDAYQRTYVIQSRDETKLDVKYLFYFLSSYVSVLRKKSIGGVIKYIKLNNLTEPMMPLPPLHIQEQIADILDKADTLRRKDQELLQKYDELAQSIFYDMFGDPEKNSKGWIKKRLDDCISYIGDIGSNGSNAVVSKMLQMKDEVDYAIMIRTTNFSHDDFHNNLKYVSKETYEFFSKSKIFGGEIIMNKIGSAGDFWIMPNLKKPVSLGLNQFMIKFSNENPTYIYHYLSTKYLKSLIKGSLNGAVTKSITKSAVKNLPYLSPPRLLQEKFEKAIKNISCQKELCNKRNNQVMFSALLDKYFS
jgi:type I restriction enzyme S subunit